MKLFYFHWDCGRMGDIDGIFLATEKAVEEAIGKYVYFGEVLGKHSEIRGTLDRDDIKELECSSAFIEEFERVIGQTGYNPLHYLPDEEIEDEDA